MCLEGQQRYIRAVKERLVTLPRASTVNRGVQVGTFPVILCSHEGKVSCIVASGNTVVKKLYYRCTVVRTRGKGSDWKVTSVQPPGLEFGS